MSGMRDYINIINEAIFVREPSEDALVCIGRLIHHEYPDIGDPARREFEAVLDREMPYFETYGALLYRGLALKSWKNLHPGFNFFKRNRLKAFNYVHTSTDEEVAESFLEGLDGNSKIFVKFVIISNKDFKGVDVQEFQFEYGEAAAKAMDDKDGNQAGFEHDPLFGVPEFEIILNRDAEFNVVSKEKQEECPWSDDPAAEYWIVKLEQVK